MFSWRDLARPISTRVGFAETLHLQRHDWKTQCFKIGNRLCWYPAIGGSGTRTQVCYMSEKGSAYKEHNSATHIHQSLSKRTKRNTRRSYAMNKQDLSSIFWSPFIHSYHTIRTVDISSTWQRVWRIVQCCGFLLRYPREESSPRTWCSLRSSVI